MKILIKNNTDVVAYVAVVHFDPENHSFEDPQIFRLEAHQQYWSETTSGYFFGGSINNICKHWRSSALTINQMDLWSERHGDWHFMRHVKADLDAYLVDHPEIQLANDSNDDHASQLKNFMLQYLIEDKGLYDSSLNIKEPDV